MKHRDLPGMPTFLAFETAARHLNYSQAARELGLTHGAVSRQVSQLEAALGGIRLFARDGQRMRLTDAGHALLVDVREGLDVLTRAMARHRAQPRRLAGMRPLAVSVHPAFAARWLLPRIGDFQRQHPRIELGLHPGSGLAALDGSDRIDLAIRYGPGRWPGLESLCLMKSYLVPVCSPSFLRANRIQGPADLLEVRLLRSPRQKWAPWFAAAGIDAFEPEHGTVYDDPGLLLQAALAGEGVALARTALARDELDRGLLVRVGSLEIEDTYAWHLAWRQPPACDAQDLADFRHWLQREAATFQP